MVYATQAALMHTTQTMDFALLVLPTAPIAVHPAALVVQVSTTSSMEFAMASVLVVQLPQQVSV